MKLFVLLTFVSIGIISIQGCHTKVTAPENGPKNKRSIHASYQDDMIEYFTGCMSVKAGEKTFENWRSVVSFVIKDMRWFTESDEIFCNSSMEEHTAACWSYNIDYLVKVSSAINQPSKDCISDYDQRYKIKKSSDGGARKKRSIRNDKNPFNKLNFIDHRSVDELIEGGHVDKDALTIQTFSMQNFNPVATAMPSTQESNNLVTTPATTSLPPTHPQVASCNKREDEFKDCLERNTAVQDSSGARSFTVTLLDAKREPTFDKSILDFISNHLSDCNASKPERMNQISVCGNGVSGARNFHVSPSTTVTTYNCLDYNKLHGLLRNTSSKLERAKSCGSEKTCRKLRAPMNGYIKDCDDSKRLPTGTTCTFGCKIGFKLKKDKHKSTTCQHNKSNTRANWSLKKSVCEPV